MSAGALIGPPAPGLDGRPAVAPELAATPSIVARGYARRDFVRRRLLAAADGLAVVTALLLAGLVAHGVRQAVALAAAGALTLPAWVLLFKAYGLYERDVKRIGHSAVDEIPGVFHAVVLGTLAVWTALRLLPGPDLALRGVIAFGAGTLVLVLCARTATRAAIVRRLGPERILLVGESTMAALLARKLRAHREYGAEPVGALLPAAGPLPAGMPAPAVPLPVLGEPHDLARVAPEQAISRVVVSPAGLARDDVSSLLRRCHELQLKISVLPQSEVVGPAAELDDVEGVTLLGLNPPVLSRSSRILKRATDVVASALLLALLAPVMLAIAAAIKLDSPGPVFFRQRRMGRRGRPIRLLKFRSMHADAEARRAELLARSEDPNWLKLAHDPRITHVGRVLRLSSLDELPQLWNVLTGEMSMVGPRPLIESEDRQVEGWGRCRLDLTPGLTGLWQVLGRTSIPFEEMVKLDYLYVTNWSLWGDVRLLLRTLPAVMLQRGAN